MRIERLKCDCCNVEGEPNSSWWIAGPILEDGEIGDNDYRWTIRPTYDVCGQKCLITALARLASDAPFIEAEESKQAGTNNHVVFGFTRYWESE